MADRRLLVALLPLALVACATTGTASKDKSPPSAKHVVVQPAPSQKSGTKPKASPYAPATEDLSKRGNYVAGGLYLPGVSDTVPDEIPDVDAIPEPEVRDEPRSRAGNRDYSVLGKRYRVLDDPEGYVETGLASYYGKKFHGRRTSSQEVYDMYAFTAAHKTLPLPSFARVTNLDNGKSIVVRINDRGPFHPGRVIDLSYAAAVKLGYRDNGTARVEVRALTQADVDTSLASQQSPAEASAMDHLVDRLPEVLADAGPAATAPIKPAEAEGNNKQYRFDMRQDGRVMQAEEFDAWMKSRRVRVATGKPGIPDPVSAPVQVAEATPLQVEPARQLAAPTPPSPITAAALVAATAPANASLGDSVVLQVASFSNAQNAQHALALLQGAAIGNAQLLDADVNGKTIWRLRVGPVAAATAPELAARVVGLGFGQPQRVRD
ncbi:septal ring lytic transglycosylase RlpA family protein [Thermomonas sp.]|uniref:septal ring lytic transglycosylase RlpA family protein n=1 Tax=Thermomonas sp. TaxID=1971895 RepID=UPI0024884025|nr:septal ring lytic transglycosylase RlpA family protein [Thermomonas sp.]MDI1254033.1 septal ring lytic transglycosylase RlpA family protein [Thermomonas sp.]